MDIHKSPQELGVSDWREAHYATRLAVWNALKQIDINDLDFRNKNVESNERHRCKSKR